MNKVKINVGFHFEGEHYAQMVASISRTEANSIPELRLEPVPLPAPAPQPQPESDNEIEEELPNLDQPEEIDEDNDMDNGDEDNLNEADLEAEMEADFDAIDDPFLDEDSDSVSSESEMRVVNLGRTKRLKGETKDFLQLPDKRPRKSRRKLDDAEDLIKREEKDKKRKQYIKKQVEAQEKATLEKILNETGRKMRQREEKEFQEEMLRESKSFKSLGHQPKIVSTSTENGTQIQLYGVELFPAEVLAPPQPKMREPCAICLGKIGKYRLVQRESYVCSLPCYKKANQLVNAIPV